MYVECDRSMEDEGGGEGVFCVKDVGGKRLMELKRLLG